MKNYSTEEKIANLLCYNHRLPTIESFVDFFKPYENLPDYEIYSNNLNKLSKQDADLIDDASTIRWTTNASQIFANKKSVKPFAHTDRCPLERVISLHSRHPKNPIWPTVWKTISYSVNSWEDIDWLTFFHAISDQEEEAVFSYIPEDVVFYFIKHAASDVWMQQATTLADDWTLFTAGYHTLLDILINANAIDISKPILSPWLLPHMEPNMMSSVKQEPIAPPLTAVTEIECTKVLIKHKVHPFTRATITGLTSIASLFNQDSQSYYKQQRQPILQAMLDYAFPKEKLEHPIHEELFLYMRYFECLAQSREPAKDIPMLKKFSPKWFKAVISDKSFLCQLAIINPIALGIIFKYIDKTSTFELVNSNFSIETQHKEIVDFTLFDCVLASAGGQLWGARDANRWVRKTVDYILAFTMKENRPAPLYTKEGFRRYIDKTVFLRSDVIGRFFVAGYKPEYHVPQYLFNPRPLFGIALSSNGYDDPDDLYLRLISVVVIPEEDSAREIKQAEYLCNRFFKEVQSFISQIDEDQYLKILPALISSTFQDYPNRPFLTSTWYDEGLYGNRQKFVRPSTDKAVSFKVIAEAFHRICLMAEDIQAKKPFTNSFSNVFDSICNKTNTLAHTKWFEYQFKKKTITFKHLKEVFENPSLSTSLFYDETAFFLSDKDSIIKQALDIVQNISERLILLESANYPTASVRRSI
jgi:hypothetical protein